MTTPDSNPMPDFKDILKVPSIDLLQIGKIIGRGIVGLFCLHQLSERSDHEFKANHVDEMLLTENVAGAGDGTSDF